MGFLVNKLTCTCVHIKIVHDANLITENNNI